MDYSEKLCFYGLIYCIYNKKHFKGKFTNFNLRTIKCVFVKIKNICIPSCYLVVNRFQTISKTQYSEIYLKKIGNIKIRNIKLITLIILNLTTLIFMPTKILSTYVDMTPITPINN